MSVARSVIQADIELRLRDTGNAVWSEAEIQAAINAALRGAWPSWFTETTSDCIVVCENQLEYDLPTMTRLMGVWLERAPEYVTGVVDDVDFWPSNNNTISSYGHEWTTNEFVGWHAVIYSGTGAGMYSRVIANGTYSFTVDNSSQPWVNSWPPLSTIDSGDKFMIKNVDERLTGWRRILAYRTDKELNPTKLYLTTTGYLSGMYLRLYYVTAPGTLDADADTTDVPQEWIVREAIAYLQLMRLQEAPGHETDSAENLAAMWKGLADEYRDRHAQRFPTGTVRAEWETGTILLPADYPF